MCEVLDAAEIWRETQPRARRPHRCATCDRTIAVGVRYLCVTSMLDGVWSTDRAHLPCADLTKRIQLDYCGQDMWTPAPEESLQAQIREYMCPELLRDYRDALRQNIRDERSAG